jgi:hypothetical protein
MHELLYETKPWGKEQYHNNFGCYSFIARSGSSSHQYLLFGRNGPETGQKNGFM